MKARKRRPAKNPTELVVMGANPSTEREVILPPGASISITIRIDSPEEARTRQNSLLRGDLYSPGILGRRYTSEELIKLNELTEPSHFTSLLGKTGGNIKKAVKLNWKEIDDVQEGHWIEKQRRGDEGS